MTRIQRHIFTRGAIVGALITITVISADVSGFLSPTENWLYDFRARHFQFASTKPTDQLVHVDIDDKALDVTGVGTWPWPRARLAAILDEMRLAGVKAVALDMLYSEPQDASPATTQPQGPGNDAALAAAIAKLGCVVVPASASFEQPAVSADFGRMVEYLSANPQLDEAALARQLSSESATSSELSRRVFDNFIEARKEAMFQRIAREMAQSPRSRDDLRKTILGTQKELLSSPVQRVFDQQYERLDAVHAIERLGAQMKNPAPSLVQVSMRLPPISSLAHATAATGFVDYKTDRDGVLRSVPLLADHDGHVIPQMGLSLALLTLGLKPSDIQINGSSIVLPGPGGKPIVIPTYSEYFPIQQRTIATVFDIPWFGGSVPENMYDWPAHARPAQHMGINNVWAACDTLQKVIKNNTGAAQALADLHEHWGIAIDPTTHDMGNPAAYKSEADRAIAEVGDFEQMYLPMKPEEIDFKGYKLLDALKVLRLVRAENPKLGEQLRDARAELAKQLGGKSVLIGRIATGFVDLVPTSLHPRCPGVIAHGVIFNAIMTGTFWTRAPAWVTPFVSLILGLITSLLASRLSPLLGLVITLLLAGGYFCVNGYVFFDRGNMIVGLAGPLIALATVWAGCTINRIIVEVGERKRITSRFGSYVDPTLLSHVLDNPDQVRFEGETRELTVVFTDLAGFTTLSEKLGEATVPLLNEYLGRMVPIISSQGGYVNKFLGDGIMSFFGAPIPKSNHAHQAVGSVLEMQQAMEDFNREIERRGMAPLEMRAGISTGMMVVGDAGTTDRSDYTVLGDIVNLGSRLEGANKATGTKILVNDRTAELIRDQYLLRPIGALQVKGKAVWVMTYEPIAPLSQVSAQQKKLVELTGAMVDAFIPGDFEQCLVAADKLEAEFGPSPLIDIYREHCRMNIEKPPESFDGRIELTEK